MIKEGAAHHPHSLRDPRPIADWIGKNVQPAGDDRPDFVDETFTKSSYYSLAERVPLAPGREDLRHLPRAGVHRVLRPLRRQDQEPVGHHGHDGHRAEDRGPGEALGVPRGRASGGMRRSTRPCWPRAFTSSSPPSPRNPARCGNSGTPVYKLLTDHGFSKKPVLEGDRDGGRGSLRLGHREPRQGRLHLRPRIPSCAASCRRRRRSITWPRWRRPACRSSTSAAASTPGSTTRRASSRSATRSSAVRSRSSSRKARDISARTEGPEGGRGLHPEPPGVEGNRTRGRRRRESRRPTRRMRSTSCSTRRSGGR